MRTHEVFVLMEWCFLIAKKAIHVQQKNWSPRCSAVVDFYCIVQSHFVFWGTPTSCTVIGMYIHFFFSASALTLGSPTGVRADLTWLDLIWLDSTVQRCRACLPLRGAKLGVCECCSQCRNTSVYYWLIWFEDSKIANDILIFAAMSKRIIPQWDFMYGWGLRKFCNPNQSTVAIADAEWIDHINCWQGIKPSNLDACWRIPVQATTCDVGCSFRPREKLSIQTLGFVWRKIFLACRHGNKLTFFHSFAGWNWIIYRTDSCNMDVAYGWLLRSMVGGGYSEYGLDTSMALNEHSLEWARSGLHVVDRTCIRVVYYFSLTLLEVDPSTGRQQCGNWAHNYYDMRTFLLWGRPAFMGGGCCGYNHLECNAAAISHSIFRYGGRSVFVREKGAQCA